jgi:hypothetical protein
MTKAQEKQLMLAAVRRFMEMDMVPDSDLCVELWRDLRKGWTVIAWSENNTVLTIQRPIDTILKTLDPNGGKEN